MTDNNARSTYWWLCCSVGEAVSSDGAATGRGTDEAAEATGGKHCTAVKCAQVETPYTAVIVARTLDRTCSRQVWRSDTPRPGHFADRRSGVLVATVLPVRATSRHGSHIALAAGAVAVNCAKW